jgi:folate-binding protein YgfZ
MHSVSFLSDITPKLPAASQANDLACLKLSGADTVKFLQGQTSCDFSALSQTQGLHGAVCNIKGRVIANFYALQQADDILLILASDLVETLQSHLKKYAVFFKTALVNATQDYQIEYIFSQDKLIPQEDFPYPCQELEHNHSLIQISEADVNQYLSIRPTQSSRALGLPDLNDELIGLNLISGHAIINKETSEKFIPQMLNMQFTHGVNFKKGCYTGQEIVARMQYRGNLKKHLYLFCATNTLDIPVLAKLTNQDGKEVAEVITSSKLGKAYLIYAIVGDESAQTQLFWQNTPLTLEPLPYA